MDVLASLAFPSADFIDHESYPGLVAALGARLDDLVETGLIPSRPQFQGDYTDRWELVADVRPGETGLSVHVMTDDEPAM